MSLNDAAPRQMRIDDFMLAAAQVTALANHAQTEL
jgi:hypothetical protein